MKIVILYSYNKGYLSSFFFELSTKLVKEGHEILNFSLKSHPKTLSKNGIDMIIKKKAGYLSNYFQIFRLILQSRPDIVLSNFSYVNPALLFGKLFGVKRNMVWFHSLNEQMESSKLNIFVKKQFLKLADTVIANSFLTEVQLNDVYKVPTRKLKSIPFWSGIPTNPPGIVDLKISNDPKILKMGCPGRLAAHKNHKVAIEAVYKIKQDHNFDFHLFIAGTGEEMNYLKNLTNELHLDQNVSFLGHLSAEEMIAFYKSMDVIILPSLHEAFGLVFIEAISLGTPVLVSSAFGALSFIEDSNGMCSKFTFNPESVDELVAKMKYYHDNSSLSTEDFKRLYNENFDKEHIFKTIHDLMINEYKS